ncbi:hypothetical protein DFH09DRAFT_1158034 [Mycena vulgaris]|nr:hypothetical protein DFH09DRAFT_1158034 [Mycena vulgaris]
MAGAKDCSYKMCKQCCEHQGKGCRYSGHRSKQTVPAPGSSGGDPSALSRPQAMFAYAPPSSIDPAEASPSIESTGPSLPPKVYKKPMDSEWARQYNANHEEREMRKAAEEQRRKQEVPPIFAFTPLILAFVSPILAGIAVLPPFVTILPSIVTVAVKCAHTLRAQTRPAGALRFGALHFEADRSRSPVEARQSNGSAGSRRLARWGLCSRHDASVLHPSKEVEAPSASAIPFHLADTRGISQRHLAPCSSMRGRAVRRWSEIM